MISYRSIIIMVVIALATIFIVSQVGCSPSKNASDKKAPQQETKAPASETEETEKVADEPVEYVCPMHPDEKSTDPDAKCSICGMQLEPAKDVKAEPQIYACPMHPEQHSTNPDDKCSICGMKYEPVTKAD